MGLVAKGALFVVGVLLLGVLWEGSLLVFAYLFVPPLVRKRGKGAPRVRRELVAGGALLGLAAVAFAEGGRLSPLVFGAAGGALVLPASPLGDGWKGRAVPGSVLLRRGLLPFRWAAVGELKFATRDPARALSGAEGTLLLRHSPDLRAFCIVEMGALTEAGAYARAVAALRGAARRLAHQGVYVLPLGSAEAAAVCAVPPPVNGRVPLRGDWSGGVSLLLEARGGSVRAYQLFAGDGRAGSALVRPAHRPRREVFVAEVAGESFASGRPRTDDFTSFLAHAAATAGEAFGERVAGISGDGEELSVTSPEGVRVSLGRAQLKAVMQVYG